eukprot:535482-Prymnesium_polylepis.1
MPADAPHAGDGELVAPSRRNECLSRVESAADSRTLRGRHGRLRRARSGGARARAASDARRRRVVRDSL